MVTLDTVFTEDNVRDGIAQLEQALAASKATAAEQKERLARLQEAARQEEERRAGLNEEADQLLQETADAARKLEDAFREGSALQTGLAQDLAAADRQAEEEDLRLDQAIEDAGQEYDKCVRLQQEAAAQAERMGFERDARQTRADRINDEQRSILDRLTDSLHKAEQQAGDNINEALSHWENARIEREAADSRLNLARTSLQDIEARLAETKEQLSERESALKSLEQEREAGLQELNSRHQQALAEVAAARKQKESEIEAHQAGFQRLRSLAELTESAFTAASYRMEQLSQKLHGLYAQAEEETANASQKMSNAIKQVLSQREALGGIKGESDRLEEELAAAQKTEADIKDKLLLLHTEDRDLSSAALVANDLAAEASAACQEASPELLPALKEMEEALTASAREAQEQARAKAAEVQEAEASAERAGQDMLRLRDSQDEVRQRLNEAETNCQTAEDTMLELSDQVGRLVSGRGESFDSIKDARAEYEAVQKEVRTLKDAATSAANDLRQAQLEDSRLRHGLLQLEQKAAQINNDHQKDLARLADSFKIRLAEAASALSISHDKLNRLLLNQTQKQSELEDATSLLDDSNQREQESKDALEACRAKENAITEELRAQIARQKEDASKAQALADQETEEAASRLKGANERIDSLAAAMDQAKAKIASLQKAKTAVAEGLVKRKEDLQNEFSRRKGEVDERCSSLSALTAAAADRLRQAKDNAGFAGKRAAASLAGTTAAAYAIEKLDRDIDADTERLVQLRKVEAEQQAAAAAAAAERLAREEEARKLKEAEQQKQAEENARKLKELEEAAHAAAVAEQERIARERAEQAARFEEESEQMAAGRRLEREQLLELLAGDGLNDRVQRINELAQDAARNSDFRYIKDSEIDDLRSASEFFDEQAAEGAQAFEASRAIVTSLKEKQERLQNERRHIAPLLAAAMSRLEKAGHEFDAITSARSKLQAAAADDGEVSQALADADSRLDQALEANRRAYSSVESELTALQDKTADLDQQLADTGKQFEEAVDVIEDVTAKWLYKESTAATARANLAEIDRTAKEREEFRRQKEAEAAARSQGRPAGRSFRTFFARKRKG